MKHKDIIKKAENGSPSNQMFLGHCYLIGKDGDGNKIPIDYEKAIHWLEKAHSDGVRTATYLLGTIYEEGLGVSIDVPRAIELYEKSAETDHIYALHNLAKIYAQGKSVKKNEEKALYWYGRVAAQEKGIEPTVHENSLREIVHEAKAYLKENG